MTDYLSSGKPEYLLDFARDVHSQGGEDGVIEKVLSILPENDNWCVEFGAWDGQYLSNTKYLIDAKNYSAVLIEGSRRKYEELKMHFSENQSVIAVNSFVGFDNENNLDEILKKTPIPESFDLLSIDVDGNDYHIWKAFRHYSPKIVCIEFNPTIPTEVNFVQDADMSRMHGSSLSALVELGKLKGYELVCVLLCNAIFVKSEYFGLFDITDNSPQTLRKHTDKVGYMFYGYDGEIILTGNTKMPWHNLEISPDSIQQLPGVLRKYPLNYSGFERFLFKLFKKQASLRGKIWNKLSSILSLR